MARGTFSGGLDGGEGHAVAAVEGTAVFDGNPAGVVGDAFEQEHRGTGVHGEQGRLARVRQGGLDTVDRLGEYDSAARDLGVQRLRVVEGFE